MKRGALAHGDARFERKLSSMNPAQKALWYIESHLARPLTLDEIRGVAGISRFHMVRAFAAATGFSVMRYVRARRLSEAARALADGAPDILSLALDADYGSHEAFTRAFRDHFGVTPETVRATTCLRQTQASGADRHGLNPARSSRSPAFRNRQAACSSPASASDIITATARRRHSQPVAALSPVGRQHPRPGREGGLRRLLQWRRFRKLRLHRRRRGRPISPTCRANSPAFGFPSRNMRCSPTREHISTIRRTVNTIWNHWLPASGMKAADAPNFERYDEKFDPLTGNGGLEIWVPVKE